MRKLLDKLLPSRIERQELWCHDCRNYVQFNMDVSMDGNHVLECPVCQHEHCRVVENGRITDIRWDRRNGPTITVSPTTVTFSTYSTFDSTNSDSTFLYQSWMNTTSGNS